MIITSGEFNDIAVPNAPPMRTHVFRPAASGGFPGVVLFSEIYQVTAPIRRLAAMVAGLGHVVAVPEVYHEFEPAGTVLAYDSPGTDRGNALKTTKRTAQYDADAKAALDFLVAHPACTGQVATMGVCLGGHLALRAALDPRVACSPPASTQRTCIAPPWASEVTTLWPAWANRSGELMLSGAATTRTCPSPAAKSCGSACKPPARATNGMRWMAPTLSCETKARATTRHCSCRRWPW